MTQQEDEFSDVAAPVWEMAGGAPDAVSKLTASGPRRLAACSPGSAH